MQPCLVSVRLSTRLECLNMREESPECYRCGMSSQAGRQEGGGVRGIAVPLWGYWQCQ